MAAKVGEEATGERKLRGWGLSERKKGKKKQGKRRARTRGNLEKLGKLQGEERRGRGRERERKRKQRTREREGLGGIWKNKEKPRKTKSGRGLSEKL